MRRGSTPSVTLIIPGIDLTDATVHVAVAQGCALMIIDDHRGITHTRLPASAGGFFYLTFSGGHRIMRSPNGRRANDEEVSAAYKTGSCDD